jgi:hypothetical protein
MTRQARQYRRARLRPCFGYDVSAAETAEILGISSRRLAELRRSGRGPGYVQWRRKIWYSLDDLVRFHKLYTDWLPNTPLKIDSDG